jgi:hypothetical protein
VFSESCPPEVAVGPMTMFVNFRDLVFYRVNLISCDDGAFAPDPAKTVWDILGCTDCWFEEPSLAAVSCGPVAGVGRGLPMPAAVLKSLTWAG